MRSFATENQFVGFLASKVLVLMLSYAALRNDAIHSVKSLIDKLSRNQLTSFERQQTIDILILLYSAKKLWPEDSEQLPEIQSSRRIVLGFLQSSWPQITSHALSLTSTWSTVDLCSFASLWKKIVKYVDSFEESPDKPSRLPKLEIFVSGVDLAFQRICSKAMDCAALCRLLKVFNSCLPYSERMSSRQPFQDHHYHLVEVVHTSIRKGLFGQIPNEKLSFIGATKDRRVDTENSHVLHRQVALLVFKSCALTTLLALADKNKSDLTSAGRHMFQVNHSLLTLWSWLRDESSQSGHWLVDVFSDQDNALLESMLCLTDIYVNIKLKKLPTSSPFLLKVIDPHVCFVRFLGNLSFDHSVLLDFLSSPETCFLLYFIKYLHFVVRDWPGFKDACQQFNYANESLSLSSESFDAQNKSVQQLTGQLDALDEMAVNTQEGLAKLLHRVNTERVLLSQQASGKSMEKDVIALSLSNKDVEKAVKSANELLDSDVITSSSIQQSGKSSISNYKVDPFTQHGMSKLTDYSDSDDGDDEDVINSKRSTAVNMTVEQSLMNMCSKYLDRDSDLAALGELINNTKLSVDSDVSYKVAKLTDYPSSDEDDWMDTELSIVTENLVSLPKNDTKSTTKLISENEIKSSVTMTTTEEMDTNESPTNATGGSTDELITAPSDTTLDRVMTAIIRLRIVLERLAEKQLFPYNAKPLINVLEQCEVRYEEDT